MKYNIHPSILKRISPVIFSSEEIDPSIINHLIDAAKWAPSSFNEQPWRFIVGSKGDSIYSSILESLAEANQYWAKNAPVLILVLSKQTFLKNGKANRFADYDTGMAVGNLLIQATELNIFAHQMGGYNQDFLRKKFGLQNDSNLLSVIALGFRGNSDEAPLDLVERESKERIRKNTNDFIIHPEL